jgi:hypothetical protein
VSIPDQRKQGEGAIDVPEVMEGGEAAFSLRREKYGFYN